MQVIFQPGTRAETCSPRHNKVNGHPLWHIGELMAMLRLTDDVRIEQCDDVRLTATFTTSPASRSLVALVTTEREPLAIPAPEKIDERIETSHTARRDWADGLADHGRYDSHVRRSALALKFLWYSPTGALAAAATSSLPEKLGNDKTTITATPGYATPA